MGQKYMMPVSVQLILKKENKILLMKRKNTGYEDGKYCLPGGHLEMNEEIREALIREAKEEIGIDININDIEFYKVLHMKINEEQEYIYFIFQTDSWSGDIINNEEEKCEEIIWVDVEKIPENTLNFIPELFGNNNSKYLPYNWK